MPDNDDKTVKELIDAGTRAELEKWFGLPSFEQVAEQQEQAAAAAAAAAPLRNDEELEAKRAREQAAIAAVDPRFLEAIQGRADRQKSLKLFTPQLETHVDTSILEFDQDMLDKLSTIADPREYEMPSDRADNLAECTPQALLRDLHRPELNFYKQFELVDMLAESRVDRHALITEALAFRRASVEKPKSLFREARALILELRNDKRRPWAALTQHLRNRRVKE